MPALPKLDHEALLKARPALRQSLLASWDQCPMAARWNLEGWDFTTPEQARGILFHRYAAEVLRTLAKTGEVRMPVEEALAILYEVCAQRDVPDHDVVNVPAPERRLLRMCAVAFARREFDMRRLMHVEERLIATVTYPHPETGLPVERIITGQPDAIVNDPPGGLIIPDWKTTRQPPPKYNGKDPDTPDGVSYGGYFQQRAYALLALDRWKSIDRVTLHEFYPLAGESRSATVTRDRLDNIRAELTVQVELLDRALMGGSESALWGPQPGKHCSYCPRPGKCPIPREERKNSTGVGAITNATQAREYAAQYVVADRVRDHRREALRTWCEDNGPVNVKSSKGRYQMRWKNNKTGGGRTFGLHVPEDSDRGPRDPLLDGAFEAAAKRQEEARQ